MRICLRVAYNSCIVKISGRLLLAEVIFYMFYSGMIRSCNMHLLDGVGHHLRFQ